MALLENERNILYQNANWDGWESERKQLLDEIENWNKEKEEEVTYKREIKRKKKELEA